MIYGFWVYPQHRWIMLGFMGILLLHLTVHLTVSPCGELCGLMIKELTFNDRDLSSILGLEKNLHYGKYFNFLMAFATVLLVTPICC